MKTDRFILTLPPAFREIVENYQSARGYKSMARATLELVHIASLTPAYHNARPDMNTITDDPGIEAERRVLSRVPAPRVREYVRPGSQRTPWKARS